MLNIGTIIRWETLANKAFSELDSTAERDIATLYYARTEDRTRTLDTYLDAVLNTKPGRKELQKFVTEFRMEADYIRQFMPESDKSEGTSDEPVRVTDSVGELLLKGVDADWLLNRCGLETLLVLNRMNLTDEKKRAEAKRLEWYVLMQPYIDRKVCRDMHAFFPLPWDDESMQAHTITDLDLNLANSMLQEPKNGQKVDKVDENSKKGQENE